MHVQFSLEICIGDSMYEIVAATTSRIAVTASE